MSVCGETSIPINQSQELVMLTGKYRRYTAKIFPMNKLVVV